VVFCLEVFRVGGYIQFVLYKNPYVYVCNVPIKHENPTCVSVMTLVQLSLQQHNSSTGFVYCSNTAGVLFQSYTQPFIQAWAMTAL